MLYLQATMNPFPSSPMVQLAIGMFSLGVAANSGYATTCNSILLQPADSHNSDWLILANCREPPGVYNVDNAININSCFTNHNGNLAGELQ